MRRVLFLYATNHSGHQIAADAIKKSLQKIAPDTAIRTIDFFTCNYPVLGPFIFRMYLDLMHSIPHIWDYLYDNPDVAAVTSELRRFFDFINIPKLHRIIRDFDPQAVVCTQAVPAGFIAAEKQRGNLSIPLIAAITDFVANPYWPDHQVDSYLVPDETVTAQLRKRTIPETRISVTGIPIYTAFAHRTPRETACRKLGLRPDVQTAIIMGGNHGLGHVPQAVHALAAAAHPLQLVVITGYNRPVFRLLAKKYRSCRHIALLGQVKNMSRIMDCADIVISKPGGLTSAEALAKGLPMIVLSPLPGQEERNADFLIKHRVAVRCDKTSGLANVVQGMLMNPTKMKHYRDRALALAHPFSSEEAARHILRYLP